jgi:hypothetical protein
MYNIAFTGIVIVAIFNLVDLDQTSQNVLQAVGVLWGSFFCSFAFVLPRLLESSRDSRLSNSRTNHSQRTSSAYLHSEMMKNIRERYCDDSSRRGVPSQLPEEDVTAKNKENRIISASSTLPEQSPSKIPMVTHVANLDHALSLIVPASIGSAS